MSSSKKRSYRTSSDESGVIKKGYEGSRVQRNEIQSKGEDRSKRRREDNDQMRPSEKRPYGTSSDKSDGSPLDSMLNWVRVQKTKTSEGDKGMCPSGMPDLSIEWKEAMEEHEDWREVKKAMKKDGTWKEEIKHPGPKTLSVNYLRLKEEFKDIRDWSKGRSDNARSSRNSIIVV